MLFKVALTALVGALSVNALSVPVARCAGPEPESLSLLGRSIGHSVPRSVPGLPQFKREPSFELEIRAPDNNDLNDLASREHESEQTFQEWFEALQEKFERKKKKILAKLKKKLGIKDESEPKTLKKTDQFRKRKQSVANDMKKRGEIKTREPEPVAWAGWSQNLVN